MIRQTMTRVCLRIALFVGMSALLFMQQTTPAQASTPDFRINLTYSGATNIPKDGSTGHFVAYFYHQLGVASNVSRALLFMDKGQNLAGSPFPLSLNEEQDTFEIFSNLAPGPHHFQAQYYLMSAHSWIVSNIITLTVARGTAGDTTCFVHNIAYTYGQGQTLLLDMEINEPDGVVDWQNGTFSVFFTGPSTLTYTKLKPNAHEQVSVRTPRVLGDYQMGCRFEGSPAYKASNGYSVVPVKISYLRQIGGISLYTTPTTIQGNEVVTWYVVVHPGRGLPTPTGTINIICGNGTLPNIHLSAQGTALVKIRTLTTFDPVMVLYFGSDLYASALQKFPLKNPPIPR